MKPTDKKAYSNIPPIAKIESLASILSVDAEELLGISSNIDTLWRPGKLLFKKMVIQDLPLMQNLLLKIYTNKLKTGY